MESEALPRHPEPPVKVSRRAVIKARFADQVRFFGSVLRAPRTTGAVAPTSTETAALMASHVTAGSGLPVLELGPGTGAITKAILAAGLPPERLYAIEYSDRFCRLLHEAWPKAHFLKGDAFALRETLGPDGPELFDAIISGLPLLNFPKDKRESLLKQALDLMPPGRPFVQFSYGVAAPVKPSAIRGIQVTRSSWNLKNVPPARVWVYRRAT